LARTGVYQTIDGVAIGIQQLSAIVIRHGKHDSRACGENKNMPGKL
jgi:hypothetical protein